MPNSLSSRQLSRAHNFIIHYGLIVIYCIICFWNFNYVHADDACKNGTFLLNTFNRIRWADPNRELFTDDGSFETSGGSYELLSSGKLRVIVGSTQGAYWFQEFRPLCQEFNGLSWLAFDIQGPAGADFTITASGADPSNVNGCGNSVFSERSDTFTNLFAALNNSVQEVFIPLSSFSTSDGFDVSERAHAVIFSFEANAGTFIFDRLRLVSANCANGVTVTNTPSSSHPISASTSSLWPIIKQQISSIPMIISSLQTTKQSNISEITNKSNETRKNVLHELNETVSETGEKHDDLSPESIENNAISDEIDDDEPNKGEMINGISVLVMIWTCVVTLLTQQ